MWIFFLLQEIDLVTGTIGNIQNGSKKLIKRAYPIYALVVDDGLIYAAGSSFDGSIVKVIYILLDDARLSSMYTHILIFFITEETNKIKN